MKMVIKIWLKNIFIPNIAIAKMIRNWQHLLELESLYGPVSSEPKLSVVLRKFDEVWILSCMQLQIIVALCII